MEQLTKEHFDRALEGLATKEALEGLATKEDAISMEARIIKRIDESQEELARMVAAGFEDIQKRLDVREQVAEMEKTFGLKFHKLEEALHIKL